MPISLSIRHRVQEHRRRHGLSQEELARRIGLSRAAVSAIETGRVIPSTAAALALAAQFGCRVEDIFALRGSEDTDAPTWAWMPPATPCRFWRARVGGRMLLYPADATAPGALPADGVWRDGTVESHTEGDPDRTLVLAGCDPAVGLLAAQLAPTSGIRLLAFKRPSRQALELLGEQRVHAAGVHLQDTEAPRGNRQAVQQLLGRGYKLLRVSRWQEGLALAPGLGITSIKQAVSKRLRWVGRPEGSGARRCLDWILADRQTLPPGYAHVASDHVGVVETIRTGWAQAGVCVRLPAQEAGLTFLVVREEDYDLCYRADMEDDLRM
ncbi:MAG: substrate-binding domain-containing protein, partial [Gaiellaceae bacterium]